MPIAISNPTFGDFNQTKLPNQQVKVTGNFLAALKDTVNSSVQHPLQRVENNSYRLNSMHNQTISTELTSKINEINQAGNDIFIMHEQLNDAVKELTKPRSTFTNEELNNKLKELEAKLKNFEMCLAQGRDKLATRLDSSYDVDCLTEKAGRGLNLSKNALSSIIESGYKIVRSCKTLKSSTREDLLKSAHKTINEAVNHIKNDFKCLQDAMLLSGIVNGVKSFQSRIECITSEINKYVASKPNITKDTVEKQLNSGLQYLGDDKDNALTLLLNNAIESNPKVGQGLLSRSIIERILLEASNKPVFHKLSPAALKQCLNYIKELTTESQDYMINQNDAFMQLIVCAINDSNEQNQEIARELLTKYNKTAVIEEIISEEGISDLNDFKNNNQLIFINKNQDQGLAVKKENASKMIFFNPQNKATWRFEVDYRIMPNRSGAVSKEKLFKEEFAVFKDSYNKHLETSLVAKMLKALPFGEYSDEISNFMLGISKDLKLDADSQKKLAAILKTNFITTIPNLRGKPDIMLLNPDVALKLYQGNVGMGFQKKYSKLNKDEQKDIKSFNENIKLNNAIGFSTAAYIFNKLLDSEVFTFDISNNKILKDISLCFMEKAVEQKLDEQKEENIKKGIDDLRELTLQPSSEQQSDFYADIAQIAGDVVRKLTLKDPDFIRRELYL